MKGSPPSIVSHTVTIALFTLSLIGAPSFTLAQETEDASTENATEATHNELRALRDRMYSAYEERDMETLLKDVADDVVITWQNSDRNIGHDEFLAFYERMVSGDNALVKDMSSKFEVDDLSLLYGDDTAIAYGTLQDTFSMADGDEFTLDSKWTATVVKIDGSWKVASFHVSSNIFDNAILSVAKSWLVNAGIGGGVLGILVGLIIGRKTKRTA